MAPRGVSTRLARRAVSALAAAAVCAVVLATGVTAQGPPEGAGGTTEGGGTTPTGDAAGAPAGDVPANGGTAPGSDSAIGVNDRELEDTNTLPSGDTGTLRWSSVGPTPLCGDGTRPPPYRRLMRMPLCIFVAVGANTGARRIVFNVEVDQFTVLEMRGVYEALYPGKPEDRQARDAWMWGGAPAANVTRATVPDAYLPLRCSLDDDLKARGAFVSCPQVYASSLLVAPVTSLVINMEMGVVTGFAWDNECFDCGGSQCLTSPLAVYKDDGSWKGSVDFWERFMRVCGTQSCDEAQNCEPRIMLSFAGTDEEGSAMQSGALRLSNFAGESIGTLLESVQSSYENAVSSTTNTFGKI